MELFKGKILYGYHSTIYPKVGEEIFQVIAIKNKTIIIENVATKHRSEGKVIPYFDICEAIDIRYGWILFEDKLMIVKLYETKLMNLQHDMKAISETISHIKTQLDILNI